MLLLAAPVALHLPAQTSPDLESNFRQPPPETRPKTYWLWMNGNVTRDGITRDLEAMSRVGIGGVLIFDGGTYLPKGPVGYLDQQWRDLMTHAIREGDRVGVQVGMHNGPGWSSTGGPWITPERSMQQLVWTEKTVQGPGKMTILLTRPRANLDYYRDAFVLAFPSQGGEEHSFEEQISNTSRTPDGVTFEMRQPFEARSITVQPAFNGRFPNVTLEASQDGVTYQRVTSISNPGRHGIQPPGARNFPAVTARYFRLRGAGASDLAEIVLHHTPQIEDWPFKANFAYRVRRQIEMPADAAREFAIDPKSVVDLTAQMDSQGRLTWDVPPGNWTILRIGQTTTGQQNVSASAAGSGLECDKFSRDAVDFHFRKVQETVLKDAGPLAGKSFDSVMIDSYEAGMQNWSAGFPEEFRKRAGYDIRGYLPAMTGRIVGDATVSERFLFDVRRTQADLMSQDYYGEMGRLCKQHGLKFIVEGYGQGVFDELQVSGAPDIPTTEFWERTPWTPNRTTKMVSSAAHVYGKPVVAGESFTGEEETARWEEYPYSLKILGDLMFSLGLNQMIFHRYAHQPHPSAVPGMSMGPWGFSMDRTNTWFEQSGAWLKYLSRCQYLLRQGSYVADVLYFTGERPPGVEQFEMPVLPAGYNFDLVNAEVLLTRATVRNGRIELPGGGSYRVLMLPPDLKAMTPELMRKLRDLVAQGAKIVGPKPQFSPTLRSYPESETEMRRIADEVWGAGRVGATLELGVEPDFEYATHSPDGALSWTHRHLPEGDLYFVGNRQRRVEDVVCTFRVAGRAPELWNAETGEIRKAAIYSAVGDRMRVPLHLGPAESVFVVFREPASTAPRSLTRDGVRIAAAEPFAKGTSPKLQNNFTMTAWAKPDIDLRLMPKESTTGRLDETGKFYVVVAAEGDKLYGKGHASAGLAVGRNGVYVVERSSTAAPAVLVANIPVSGWTHFVVVYRDGKPRLYVNGNFVKEGLVSGSIVHPGVGDPPPDPGTVYHFDQLDTLVRQSAKASPPSGGIAYYFEGNMTEPQVMDHALLDDEIRQLAAHPLPPPSAPPDAEIWRRADGKMEGLLSRSGNYQLEGGGSATVQVDTPVEIAGPWRVVFQEGRAAPPSVEMSALTGWNRSQDPAVKYFSGTATYSHGLNVPAAFLQPDKRVVLDLGRVEVIAQVRINGRDAGTLWKEPYRIDITGLVKAGANELEIRVTNLWPNRMIGDEELPAENQYATGAEHGILKLPDWYRDALPKPAGGRTTFVTWKFYQKGDPLLEGGLLGPVRLFALVRRTFE